MLDSTGPGVNAVIQLQLLATSIGSGSEILSRLYVYRTIMGIRKQFLLVLGTITL